MSHLTIHYSRNVKIQAQCCQKIFPCRHCHDEVSDHALIRAEIKNMLCMVCMTLQPADQICQTCHTSASRYYCSTCHFWNDAPDQPTFHCDACGLCRSGQGLGVDTYHCPKCRVCIRLEAKDSHPCLERSLESNCPLCAEYMFTSTTPVIVMKCGHAMHKSCYQAYLGSSAYQCPICKKSIREVTAYFQKLRQDLINQPMPKAYQHHRSLVFCNDCEQKSDTPYHFLYHQYVPNVSVNQ
ncbi:hypothetical protein BC941DRAFT_464017 [Chlamydoabsidia padenii]|nr:hypothetical protein BC941DRAFT_464017 [Chlamydoabsidia padenii]